MTVRRALASLTDDGLVHAIQGRGTFVASGRLAEPPNTLLSFHELVANEHVVVGAQPLKVDTRAATIDEAEVFGIAPGPRCSSWSGCARWTTCRWRSTRRRCRCPSTRGFPAWTGRRSRCTRAWSRPATAPSRPTTRSRRGPRTPRSGRLLAAAPGSPVLVAESEVSDVAGRVIVVGVITYRGDRYRFRSRLTAGSTVPIVRTPARPR